MTSALQIKFDLIWCFIIVLSLLGLILGFYLTNRMWFSVVYSFIDNDTRHHSGQNVVDSRGADLFFTTISTSKKKFVFRARGEKGIA